MSTPRSVADQAVRRGVQWLDKHVPKWREKVDRDSLDLQYPCQCVLGQLEGDFYQAMWEHRLSRAMGVRLGLSAGNGVGYPALTAAWKRALKDSQ